MVGVMGIWGAEVEDRVLDGGVGGVGTVALADWSLQMATRVSRTQHR
jgi:hypothetical protein